MTQNRWWTDKTLTTDKDGKLSLRGFKGTYSVECGGVSEAVILGDEEATVTLKLR